MRDIVAVCEKMLAVMPEGEYKEDFKAFFVDYFIYVPPEVSRDEWRRIAEWCKTHIGVPDADWKIKFANILRDVKEG